MSNNENLKAALPEYLADSAAPNYNVKLGISLRQYSDVQFASGLKLTKGPVKHHAAKWQVVNTNSPYSFTGEPGEVNIMPTI